MPWQVHLVHQPKLILLDEPTSGLDPHQVDQFRQLIASLSKDTALLVSTHILNEVEQLCDRCLILHEGRLVADLALPCDHISHWELECDTKGKVPHKSLWQREDRSTRSDWSRFVARFESEDLAHRQLQDLISAGVKVMSFFSCC